MRTDNPLTFWRWFFVGRNGHAGWLKFRDRWLLLHVAVGLLFAFFLPGTLLQASQSVLLPLAGIFVGMSFAWVGNAQAILQSAEAEQLYQQHPGGFENYAYSFQTAILVILITLGVWGIAALGVLDLPCPWACPGWLYQATVGALFFLASLTFRECWHVVLGAQLLLLAQRHIRRLPSKDRDVA